MPAATKITPKDESTLFVEFDTGEQFHIPYLDLRFACPCATCVDELTGRRTLKKENLKPDVKPRRVEPVGRYAVQILWSDGHGTGMYHFDTIYDLGKKTALA